MGEATFLMGYDVEHLDPAITRAFLARAIELHHQYEVPATFFVLGETLERNVEALAPLVDNSLFDIQQHTYSHTPLKTLVQRNQAGTEILPGATLDRIRLEVTKASEMLKRELGVECTGLTGPYGYYRGLSDRPDILAVLRECGIRFLRTDARNQEDWQPVPFTVQPYRYEQQGYPDIIEFGIQGWADCLLREELGWGRRAAYLRAAESDLDHIAEHGLVWSYVQHDWASIREDTSMDLTEAMLAAVVSRGIRADTYAAYAERELARLPGVR